MRVATTPWIPALVLFALLACLPAAAPAGDETLTLRINDAMAAPGGLVAVVVRTYAPRPVGDGQIGFGPTAAPDGPFVWMNPNPIVFSRLHDAVVEGFFDPATQEILVGFESPSATINAVDGPLLVAYLRLATTVVPGQTYPLAIELPDTYLYDEGGAPIPIEPRAGELEVRHPSGPFEVQAEGDKVEPGETAVLAFATQEVRGISSGQVGLHYDPTWVVGAPRVRTDRRYGRARYRLVSQSPGEVVVRFRSPDASLNRLPGQLVVVEVDIRADAPRGTVSEVLLDPDRTFLIGENGTEIPLAFESGTLEIE